MRLTPDTHLHSREHLLADDLSHMMLEPKHFPTYLGIARNYHESDLRALAKRVLAKRDLDPRNRGKYFFAALKGLEKKWIFKTIRAKPGHLKKNAKTPRHTKTA